MFFTDSTRIPDNLNFSNTSSDSYESSESEEIEERLNFTMTPEAANKICQKGESIQDQHVIVYGFEHCLCQEVESSLALHTGHPPLYDQSAYDDDLSRDEVGRICKEYLTSAVIENCKRRRKGEKPLSIIFCIDVNDNPYPLTAENILSKTKLIPSRSGNAYPANKKITHRELRRVLKLFYSRNVPEEFRKVAQASFKFFKVETEITFKGIKDVVGTETSAPVQVFYTEGTITDLIEVAAPWKTLPDWREQWLASQAQKGQNGPQEPKSDWKAIVSRALSRMAPSTQVI